MLAQFLIKLLHHFQHFDIDRYSLHDDLVEGVGNEVLLYLFIACLFFGILFISMSNFPWGSSVNVSTNNGHHALPSLSGRQHRSNSTSSSISNQYFDISSNSTQASAPPHPSSPLNRRHFGSTDGNCPVCLNRLNCATETNCGHLFCASCIIAYWKHAQWRGGSILCPVCRQQVTIMFPCFQLGTSDGLTEVSESANQERASFVREINDYNRKFSGEPRPWFDYLYDLPTLLRHLSNDFFSYSGIIHIFRLRIVICVVSAIMYLISPLDMIPEAIFGLFGLLDDIVVVLLLAIYATIIYRNYLSERWQIE